MLNEIAIDPIDAIDLAYEQGIDTWEMMISIGIADETEMSIRRWRQGDLAFRIDTRYGEKTIAKFAAAIGVNTSTLKQRKAMSGFYEKDTRVSFPNLGYSHYREAMRLGVVDHALEALEQASQNEWPVWVLKEHIDEQLGKEKTENQNIPGIIENIFERDGKGIIEIAIAPEDIEFITEQMAVNIKTKAN